mgnify:FL=1
MTLKGIDVASYQASMDVSTYPCDFVICKATEGTSYVNPVCDKHYQQAKSSGKLLGVYHFARPDTGNSAEAEADFFIENIKGYIGEAILALDMECAGWQKYSAWAKTWLDRVYAKTGARPLFYSPGSGFENYRDMLNAGDYGVWACSDDSYYAGATIVMKQSVYDNLDHDEFYGDAEAWRKYANPSGESKPAQEPQKQPTQKPVSSGIAVGDTVRPNSLIDYNGNNLSSYHDTYTVSEINGNRAVLTAGGQVWAAMNVSNLTKVGGGSAPAPSSQIMVGDRVRVLNAVTYNGHGFHSWYDTYTVMELNGDRAVIGVNGTVTAAINVCNIAKA